MSPNQYPILPAELRHQLGKVRTFLETNWARATHDPDWLVRRTFNRWAGQGRGDLMAKHHAGMAETIWERMELCATDRILDLGCGQGWACNAMASRAPRQCEIVGVDISDQMIRLARERCRPFSNVTFHCGSVDDLQWPDNYFTKIISIEAFYYFMHQEQVVKELLRVIQPGGQLFLLICCFREDAKPFDKVGLPDELPVRVHSAKEYESMLQSAGWADARTRIFHFGTDASDFHERALLITAQKPVTRTRPVLAEGTA
jgi:SAM-dependent methyltransferase